VTAFPSFGYVDDPDRPGQLKLVSLTGAIHGREAAIANNYGGYHKTPAGTDVVLSRVLQLPTGRLNEEVLNPQGINVLKFVKGNCILWGGRTIAIDSAWRYLHHRALMSYYEHVLQENFDWVIFGINDPELQAQVLSSLRAFFMPEWSKRARRQDCGRLLDPSGQRDQHGGDAGGRQALRGDWAAACGYCGAVRHDRLEGRGVRAGSVINGGRRVVPHTN
jgi:hypothetical protein